ncbi:hypothetical protein MPSEU_000178100 [Mayamaea pseudoterrestris]|nr:hypothetical protein MPSEU_000178100 [Mayamaea pseudoterrestris]
MTTPIPEEDNDYFHQAFDVAASSSVGTADGTRLQILPTHFRSMSSPTSSPRQPRRRMKQLSNKGGGSAGADVFGCPITPQASPHVTTSMDSPNVSPFGLPLEASCLGPLSMSPRTASSSTFTFEQQSQIDAMREQVRALEIVFQEAVQKNWPTDDLCRATEAKRRELQELMMKFRTENAPFGLLHSRRMSEPPDNYSSSSHIQSSTTF